MRRIIFVLAMLVWTYGYSQEVARDTIAIPIDEKYLEDQLYIAFTFDALLNMPSGINQNGLSGGLGFGFIKDLPVNKARNFGFGLGLGYSLDIFVQNLRISENNGVVIFDKALDYNVNKLTKQSIDIPFEIRWRTSDPVTYKFWRVYAGMKFSYVFNFKTLYTDDNGTLKTQNIDEVENFQYGLSLAAGRGTWNLYVYYGLTNMFKNATYQNEPIDMYDMNIGLKFYIM